MHAHAHASTSIHAIIMMTHIGYVYTIQVCTRRKEYIFSRNIRRMCAYSVHEQRVDIARHTFHLLLHETKRSLIFRCRMSIIYTFFHILTFLHLSIIRFLSFLLRFSSCSSPPSSWHHLLLFLFHALDPSSRIFRVFFNLCRPLCRCYFVIVSARNLKRSMSRVHAYTRHVFCLLS